MNHETIQLIQAAPEFHPAEKGSLPRSIKYKMTPAAKTSTFGQPVGTPKFNGNHHATTIHIYQLFIHIPYEIRKCPPLGPTQKSYGLIDTSIQISTTKLVAWTGNTIWTYSDLFRIQVFTNSAEFSSFAAHFGFIISKRLFRCKACA